MSENIEVTRFICAIINLRDITKIQPALPEENHEALPQLDPLVVEKIPSESESEGIVLNC